MFGVNGEAEVTFISTQERIPASSSKFIGPTSKEFMCGNAGRIIVEKALLSD